MGRMTDVIIILVIALGLGAAQSLFAVKFREQQNIITMTSKVVYGLQQMVSGSTTSKAAYG